MSPVPRHSAVYRGHVTHARSVPKRHGFRYSLFYVYLDLDELTEAFRGRWLWSHERWNVASFRRKHYLGDAARPLVDCVRERCAEELGQVPAGPVRMLTNLAYFGFCFNPVTFYYLFEADGQTVGAVVAEITNTPWGERHSYVLGADQARARGHLSRWEFEKDFHVSPFFDMDQRYGWEFSDPRERLLIHMENEESGAQVFDVLLDMRRKPLTASSCARALLRHPFMTGKAVAAIYLQALLLWLKRVPFFTHPAKREPAPRHG